MAGPQENAPPGVVAPPPLIHLGFLAAAAVPEYLWPTPFLPPWLQAGAGALLVAAGSILMAACLVQLRETGTPHETWKAAERLATGGLYRFSRNPIYVAAALLHAGVAAAVDGAWLLGSLLPALIVMRWGVIAREEAHLERRFGAVYLAYKARVRRWL